MVVALASLQNNTWFVLWLQLWIKPGVPRAWFRTNNFVLALLLNGLLPLIGHWGKPQQLIFGAAVCSAIIPLSVL